MNSRPSLLLVLALLFPLSLWGKSELRFRSPQFQVGERITLHIQSTQEIVAPGQPKGQQVQKMQLHMTVVAVRRDKAVVRLSLTFPQGQGKVQKEVQKRLNHFLSSLRLLVGPGPQLEQILNPEVLFQPVAERLLPKSLQKPFLHAIRLLGTGIQRGLLLKRLRNQGPAGLRQIWRLGEQKMYTQRIPLIGHTTVLWKLQEVDPKRKVGRFYFRTTTVYGPLMRLLGVKAQVAEGTCWIGEDTLLRRLVAETEVTRADTNTVVRNKVEVRLERIPPKQKSK